MKSSEPKGKLPAPSTWTKAPAGAKVAIPSAESVKAVDAPKPEPKPSTRKQQLEAAVQPRGSGGSGGLMGDDPRARHFPLQPCNFEECGRLDSMPIEQACFVLFGFEPPPLHVLRFEQDVMNPTRVPTRDEPPEYAVALRSLRLSIRRGSVSAQRITEYPFETEQVTWPELVRWAGVKGFAVPAGLESIAARASHVAAPKATYPVDEAIHGGAVTDYLPKLATAAQACKWLQKENGGSWTLSRLLESGLMPWFWLDYTAGRPAIFGNRLEGYLAPMVFAGDIQRLEVDGAEALITMTHAHDGQIIKIEPGIKAPISELRFKRDDVQRLGSGQVAGQANSNAPALPVGHQDAPTSSKKPEAVFDGANPASDAALPAPPKLRRDSITPAIELAQSKCKDPSDTAEVWPQMQVLAQDEHPPFLASTPQGLKYHRNGNDCYFTREALDKRLHPEKRARPGKRR
jgi:hypothetical protein